MTFSEKEHLSSTASDLFRDTGITGCSEGTRYLGVTTGTPKFMISFMQHVGAWVDEIKNLTRIVLDQSQAAYAAFTHGLKSHWNYLMRTMPEIELDLQPLEDMIHLELLPALNAPHMVHAHTRLLLEAI